MDLHTQIPETDGTCPHCGKKLAGYQRGQCWYGSPIVTCKSCGKRYVDRRFHEIAVEGAVKNDLSLRRDGLVALLAVGGFAIAFGMNYHMVVTWERYSVRNVLIQALAVVLLLFAAVDAVSILTGIKAKWVERERQASEARLRDRAYAQELADLGWSVPDQYL